MEEFAPRVFGLLRARGAGSELAEELTQSTFATVAENLARYQELGKFESWLFQIAVNRWRDEVRRVGRHAPAHEQEEIDRTGRTRSGASYRPLGREESERLAVALGALQDADREVVELRHTGGLSFKQIAEVLGEPVGTLLARHHRALGKLRELLGESED